jgi:hypothetical protein
MNDPHVSALIYKFSSLEPSDRFTTAEPLRVVLDRFNALLEDERLRAAPIDHYRSEEDARSALEPRLRDWEVDARLGTPPHSIHFEFIQAEVFDRNPTSENVVALAGTADGRGTAFDASILVDNGHFPTPHVDFRSNSLVEVILDRLERARKDETRLAYDAYWVYTELCDAFGDEATAAQRLGASRNVLEKLVRIANKRDPVISRKSAGPIVPITPEERTWLFEVIRVLAWRAGQSHPRIPPLLTMADLPPLR